MMFEGHGQPVRGGPGQPGCRDQACERQRIVLKGCEHCGGFVEYADT